MSASILSGLRVVELSSGLAGPVAALILAEAGADVVKVEPPGGDRTRSGAAPAFATWNRSKRGVVLDLRAAADLAAFHQLLATADVLVHGLRPSHARELRLDDDSLAASHPRLVVCGITGYPSNHADAERPGYDLLVQARGGLMDLQVGWREGPFVWRFPVPSWGAAFLGAAGIVARLIHRESSGLGGPAHTSLLQGQHLIMNMDWNRAEHPSESLIVGQPGTLVHTQVAMYECSDGVWLQVLNPADRIDVSVMPLMRAVIARMGKSDEPFDADIMRAAMLHEPSDQWVAQLRALDVAVEEILPFGGLLQHPQVLANGFTAEVDDTVFGPTRQVGSLFHLTPPARVQRPAPRLGEHTAEVIAEWAAPVPAAAGVLAAAVHAPTAGAAPAKRMPLEGIRVVDFGAYLAGPLAPMLLGDLGAEVVKVEPTTGDPLRIWRDGFVLACNRGKDGIALDIRAPEARDVIDRLIAWADVVHHNIREKAAERLRLDGPTVQAQNPNAVFSHVSSYGLRGERADWPGYDSVFQAMGGWNLMAAGEGNPPLFNHVGNLDSLTGCASAIATLLALYHRARTGEAGTTEGALLNTTTFTASETLLRLADDTIADYVWLNQQQTGVNAGYRIYEVADGEWVAVAAMSARRLAALRAVARVTDDDEIEAALAVRTHDELLAALAAADVPAERVRQMEYFEVWDRPEHRSAGLVATYPHPEWGDVNQFGAYWNFGDLELSLDRCCPALGQHTRDVLQHTLGYDDESVTRLAAAGVIAGPGIG
ncbi:MAG: CoA transferase [Actinomycetota bacterium]|nr:CoA transferase [Actinomycetota bacterium]